MDFHSYSFVLPKYVLIDNQWLDRFECRLWCLVHCYVTSICFDFSSRVKRQKLGRFIFLYNLCGLLSRFKQLWYWHLYKRGIDNFLIGDDRPMFSRSHYYLVKHPYWPNDHLSPLQWSNINSLRFKLYWFISTYRIYLFSPNNIVNVKQFGPGFWCLHLRFE